MRGYLKRILAFILSLAMAFGTVSVAFAVESSAAADDGSTDESGSTTESVELAVGGSASYTVDGDYTSADTSSLTTSVATVSLAKKTVKPDGGSYVLCYTRGDSTYYLTFSVGDDDALSVGTATSYDSGTALTYGTDYYLSFTSGSTTYYLNNTTGDALSASTSASTAWYYDSSAGFYCTVGSVNYYLAAFAGYTTDSTSPKNAAPTGSTMIGYAAGSTSGVYTLSYTDSSDSDSTKYLVLSYDSSETGYLSTSVTTDSSNATQITFDGTYLTFTVSTTSDDGTTTDTTYYLDINPNSGSGYLVAQTSETRTSSTSYNAAWLYDPDVGFFCMKGGYTFYLMISETTASAATTDNAEDGTAQSSLTETEDTDSQSASVDESTSVDESASGDESALEDESTSGDENTSVDESASEDESASGDESTSEDEDASGSGNTSENENDTSEDESVTENGNVTEDTDEGTTEAALIPVSAPKLAASDGSASDSEDESVTYSLILSTSSTADGSDAVTSLLTANAVTDITFYLTYNSSYYLVLTADTSFPVSLTNTKTSATELTYTTEGYLCFTDGATTSDDGTTSGGTTYYLKVSDGGTLSLTTTESEATEAAYMLKNGSQLNYGFTFTSVSGTTESDNLYISGSPVLAESSQTTVTFTGVAAGSTSVTIGGVTYNITVYTDIITIYVGNSYIASIEGTYTSSDLSGLDTSIASADFDSTTVNYTSASVSKGSTSTYRLGYDSGGVVYYFSFSYSSGALTAGTTTNYNSATAVTYTSEGYLSFTQDGTAYYLNVENGSLTISTSGSTSWTYSDSAGFTCTGSSDGSSSTGLLDLLAAANPGGQTLYKVGTTTSNDDGSSTFSLGYVSGDFTYYVVFGSSGKVSSMTTSSASGGTVTYTSDKYLSVTSSGTTYYLNLSDGKIVASTTASTTWEYSETDGFYCTDDSDGEWYLTDFLIFTDSSSSAVYAYGEATGTAATAVTFTGVSAGTTTAAISGGSTSYTYKIIVLDSSNYVTSTTSPFIGSTITTSTKNATSYSTVTTAGYSGCPVTGVYMSLGLSYAIKLNTATDTTNGSNGVTVQSGGTWTIADSSVATFDSDSVTTNSDGSVSLTDTSGTAVTIKSVSAGTTTLTYTVNGKSYTIPITIVDYWDYDSSSSTEIKVYELYVTEITATSTYMAVIYGEDNSSVNCADFVEVGEGEVIYISFPYNAASAVDFFGTPDDGYALTLLGSINSAQHYMTMESDNPGETEFVSLVVAAGYNQVYYYGSGAVFDIVQAALDYDSDGGMGFTRPASSYGNVSSAVTVRSQKLPTIEKEVTSITRGDGSGTYAYDSSMYVYVGDTINYTVTITQYATTEAIIYTDELFSDSLYAGETLVAGEGSGKSTLTITDSTGKSVTAYRVSETDSSSDAAATVSNLNFSNGTLSEKKTYTYTVSYTVTEDDVDEILTNTATLTYSYKSVYSSSGQSGAMSASASISRKVYEPEEVPEENPGEDPEEETDEEPEITDETESAEVSDGTDDSEETSSESKNSSSGSTTTAVSAATGDTGYAGRWAGILVGAAAVVTAICVMMRRKQKRG